MVAEFLKMLYNYFYTCCPGMKTQPKTGSVSARVFVFRGFTHMEKKEEPTFGLARTSLSGLLKKRKQRFAFFYSSRMVFIMFHNPSSWRFYKPLHLDKIKCI